MSINMPRNRRAFELSLLNAFRSGMVAAYAIEHTNLTEDENNAVVDYAKRHNFKTDAINEVIFKTER